jgi:MFS family permease
MTLARRGRLAPVIVVFVLYNLQMNMTRPFVPLFAASLDLGYLGVGVVAAAVGFLPIFFALPVGSLTDRWGIRPMVTTGAVLNATGFALLWSVPSIPMIIVTQLLAGFSNLLVTLSTQTYIGTLGKGAAAERNFSTLTIFASIGQIGGPLISGLLIGVAGFGATFATATGLSISCSIAALVLLPRTVRAEAPRSARAAPRRARVPQGPRHPTGDPGELSDGHPGGPSHLVPTHLPR